MQFSEPEKSEYARNYAESMRTRGVQYIPPSRPEFEIHEACSIFPMMSDDEFRGLVEDIRENGQREPIWIYEGRIIDGRNRYKACQELIRRPTTREWDGKGSLVGFILSLNLHRRSLTTSQRAAIANEAKKTLEAEIKEAESIRKSKASRSDLVNFDQVTSGGRDARAEAAKLCGVSKGSVVAAEKIKEASPETFERVKAGMTTIQEAKRELGLIRPTPKPEPIEPPAEPLAESTVDIYTSDHPLIKAFWQDANIRSMTIESDHWVKRFAK